MRKGFRNIVGEHDNGDRMDLNNHFYILHCCIGSMAMAGYIRMVLHLDKSQKRLIELAAAHRGLSLSDFTRDTLLREAQQNVTSGGMPF